MSFSPKVTWEKLRTSLWFIPSASGILAVIASYFVLQFDQSRETQRALWWLSDLNIGINSVRQVLVVTTSSVMTLTGVVFSISVVALSMASNQFGPKILRNFVSDSTNKIVLGLLIATFMYGLVTLSILDSHQNNYIPLFTTLVNLLLTSIAVAGLIYFIHRVSTAIQADQIIAEIGDDIANSIVHICVDSNTNEKFKSSENWEKSQDQSDYPIRATATGYVQSVNYKNLVDIANQHNCAIEITIRAGMFILPDSQIGSLYKNNFKKSLINEITNNIIIDRKRTPVQDIEYSIDQLVQVALRALSPGINDSITAITCIDWLGASILKMSQCTFPPKLRADEKNILRLKVHSFTFEGAVNTAINPIRQNCYRNVMVSIHLLNILVSIWMEIKNIENQQVIKDQIDSLTGKINLNMLSSIDRRKTESILEKHHKHMKINRY